MLSLYSPQLSLIEHSGGMVYSLKSPRCQRLAFGFSWVMGVLNVTHQFQAQLFSHSSTSQEYMTSPLTIVIVGKMVLFPNTSSFYEQDGSLQLSIAQKLYSPFGAWISFMNSLYKAKSQSMISHIPCFGSPITWSSKQDRLVKLLILGLAILTILT